MKHVAKDLRTGRWPPSKELKAGLDRLTAARVPGRNPPLGRLSAGPLVLRCAIGAGGVRVGKREGDHASPRGSFRLLSLFYRPGRFRIRPQFLPASLPARQIGEALGWCDDPDSAVYNRLIMAPFRQSHENLWRDDHLYDIVIVLDYNLNPRRKGRGSAIFLHCARPDFAPTEGCVALRHDDLRRLLPRLSKRTTLTIK